MSLKTYCTLLFYAFIAMLILLPAPLALAYILCKINCYAWICAVAGVALGCVTLFPMLKFIAYISNKIL